MIMSLLQFPVQMNKEVYTIFPLISKFPDQTVLYKVYFICNNASCQFKKKMVKVNLLNIFTGSETPVKRYFLSKILVHIIFSFISNFQIKQFYVKFTLFVTMLLVNSRKKNVAKVNLLNILRVFQG